MSFIRRYCSLMLALRLRSEILCFSFAVRTGDPARGSLSFPRPLVSREVPDSVGAVGCLALPVFFLVVRAGAMPVFVVVFVVVVYRCGSGNG